MKILLSALTCFLIISCKNNSDKKFDKIEKSKWLIGNWENKTKEFFSREVWNKKTDSSYVAESYILVEKDTVFYEKVDLVERNDSLFYIVSVRKQNNEKPVSFFATKVTENELVVENPKHDFPTKISYNLITKDSAVGKIFGIKDGKTIEESFPMKKQN